MSPGPCKRCRLPLARPESQAEGIRETLAEAGRERARPLSTWAATYMETELGFLLAWLEGVCSFCHSDDLRAKEGRAA